MAKITDNIGVPLTALDLYNPANARFLDRDFVLCGPFHIEHACFPNDQVLILVHFQGCDEYHACLLGRTLVYSGLPADADFEYGDDCIFQFQNSSGELKMVCVHRTMQ